MLNSRADCKPSYNTVMTSSAPGLPPQHQRSARPMVMVAALAVVGMAAAGLWFWASEPSAARVPDVPSAGVAGTSPTEAARTGAAAPATRVVAVAAPGMAPSYPMGNAVVMAEPSGDLQVPTAVNLQRAARQPRATVADEAPASAQTALQHDRVSDTVSYLDGQGRAGRAQLSGAVVGEGDVGLRAYPGAVANPAGSSTVSDPAAGQTAVAAFTSGDALKQVVAFYRAQAKAMASAQTDVSESAAVGAGPWQWQIVDRGTGVNRSVLVVQDGTQVSVTLTRWQPAVPAPKSGG